MAEQPPEKGEPRLGFYVGKASSVTSPGDDVTWEIALLPDVICSIDCSSVISANKGGSQPWRIEGTWEWDGDEEEVTVLVTQDSAFGGPKVDRELALPMSEEGALTFRFANQGASCVWTRPPPDLFEEELATLSAKEIKNRIIEAGLDPVGCIEREQLEMMMRRAKASGALKEPKKSPVAAAKPAANVPEAKEEPKAQPSAESKPAPLELAAPQPHASEPAAPAEAAPSPAAPAPAEAAPAPAEAAPAQGDAEGIYTLEQLTDKRVWEKLDIKATEREVYLPEATFIELFGCSKAEFAKMPKWKRDGLKKKHELF